MTNNNCLVSIDGGWTWADNDLAREAKKEFESVMYAMNSDRTAKLMGDLMAEALGAGLETEEGSELLVNVLLKAIKKMASDAQEHWGFIRKWAGLDDNVEIKYDWPTKTFSIVEPVLEDTIDD